MPPKIARGFPEKNSFFSLEVILKMSFHYKTKVSQRGNPFDRSLTFEELFKRRSGRQ